MKCQLFDVDDKLIDVVEVPDVLTSIKYKGRLFRRGNENSYYTINQFGEVQNDA